MEWHLLLSALCVIQVGSVLVDIVLESLKIPNVLKSIENLT